MFNKNKFFFVTLLSFLVSCLCLYIIVSLGSSPLGKNSAPIGKERGGGHEKRNSWMDNSIPIRRAHSAGSFVARAKRQAKESPPQIILPSAELTKSSQRIQFTPTLRSYYTLPESIASYYVTGQRQFTPGQYVQSPSFVPGFLQFQQQQQQQQQRQPVMQLLFGFNAPSAQPLCHLSQWNSAAGEAFYCSYIPVSPTYQFPEVPGITDLNRAALENAKGGDADLVGATYANPFEQLFKDLARECPVNFYQCADGTSCISKARWCDNRVDCADASDETKCSCRERVGRERLCDNYADCPHSEDELGCFGCPKSTFSCNDSPTSYNKGGCISREARCDGSRQCSSGRDEEHCGVLTESYAVRDEMFPVGYHLGFLHRNWKGKWYPVCGHAYTWAREACAAEVEASEDPQLETVALPSDLSLAPFLMESGYEGKLLSSCPSGLTYVRCPAPPSRSRLAEPTFLLGSSGGGSRNGSSEPSDPIVSIVGGHDSSPRAWPFVVAINKNGYFHCGGAVLNEWWVLSAAHCFADYDRQYYEVEAGMLRRLSYSPSQQIRRLDGVVVHPSYDATILKNDIALGLLSEPFLFNSWVRPVRLPEARGGRPERPAPGSVCVAVGWGATQEGGRDPDHLREVEVPIVSCRRLEDRNRAEICAGFRQGGRDACQGDSGGPLMCRESEAESEWYIGGIVSHGIGCGRRNEPGAYTKVSYFVDWINSIMSTRKGSFPLMRPRSSCPGFSCNRPHARCLPAKRRCNRVVDCLEAEDEINCPTFGGGLGFLELLLGSQKLQEPNLKDPKRTSARRR